MREEREDMREEREDMREERGAHEGGEGRT